MFLIHIHLIFYLEDFLIFFLLFLAPFLFPFYLHDVSYSMITPAESIDSSAKTLCDHYEDITLAEANKIKDNIQQQGEMIIELLDQKFNVSSNKARKENNHG